VKLLNILSVTFEVEETMKHMALKKTGRI